MADLLGVGNAWLESMRRRHRTTPVQYRQGDTTTPLDATTLALVFTKTAIARNKLIIVTPGTDSAHAIAAVGTLRLRRRRHLAQAAQRWHQIK